MLEEFPVKDSTMRLFVLPFLLLAACAAPLHAAEPAAPAQPTAAAPLAIGETFTIESKALGETRRINVYRPQPWGLDPKTPLPVLYMPDGGIGEDFLHVAGLVQVLTGNGSMRPFLLVGIENTERRRDMTGPSSDPQDQKIAPRIGGSAAYRSFLRDELMPQVRQRYATTDERALMGESLAGLFVVETLLQEPGLFNSYIALDPSLWWNKGALLAAAPKRLPAVAKTGSRVFLASSGQPELADASAKLAALLQQASPSPLVRYQPLPDETHATIYHPAALQALRTLFPLPAAAPAVAEVAPAQPYVALPDTQTLRVHDPAGRDYPIWVALPAGYAEHPQKRYPVLYVTDALYSFPLVRSVRNLVGQQGQNIEDFILVGLPPQEGLTSKQSRSRDYTPSNPARIPADYYSSDVTYGGAAHYRDFLATQVLPLVDARYRTDAARRTFAGHSYGALFGAYVLTTQPDLFSTYILSSPSLWFDQGLLPRLQDAAVIPAQPTRVLLSVGGYETIKPGPRYSTGNDMLRQAADFTTQLQRRGRNLQVDNVVIDGEDHLTVYPRVITRALLDVLPGEGPYTGG